MTSVTRATDTAGSKGKRKVVSVVLLTGEELLVQVDAKAKVYEVFNQVTAHLSLRETEYFGLALLKNEEYQFQILDEKISKIAPKKWKSGSGEGYDSQGKPLLTLWFRVQFYVDQVVLLREKVTRHLYYLQLKENVLKYNHLYSEERCFQIVAFALQADYGNYIADKHVAGYADPRLYFPAWMVEKRGVDYLGSNCPLVHQDLHNMARTDAELKYVRECSSSPGAHNLHFYRVRKKKTDKTCNIWLAVCARGVEVYEDDAGFKNLISTFLWPDIGRLVFDKKKFEIRSVGSAGGRRFAYYTDSDGTSKYLLHICRSTHMFQVAIQPKLMEIRHLDEEDKKRYRESYIYSDVRDLHVNGGTVQCRSNKSPGKSAGTQRFSVISDVSSNTTSGIVSDRLTTSFDEEESGKEILIDCPSRQTSMRGMLTQLHTKVPFRNSYKMTPPTPGSRSPVIPLQSLEQFHGPGNEDDRSSLGPELSPASSVGSYRVKLQQTSHNLYLSGKVQNLPTPPVMPAQSYMAVSPSSPLEREFPKVVGHYKESFKGLQDTVPVSVEGNTVGFASKSPGFTAVKSLGGEDAHGSQPLQVTGGARHSPYLSSAAVSTDSHSSYSPAHFTYPDGVVTYQLETAHSQTGVVKGTTDLPLQPHSFSTHLTELEFLYSEQSIRDNGMGKEEEVSAPPGSTPSKLGDTQGPFVSMEGGGGLPSQPAHYSGSGTVSSSSSFTHGGSIDSGHVLSDESNSVHHSAQSSEEDSALKDSYSDDSASFTSPRGKPSTPAKTKAGNKSRAKHVSVKNQKEALHPDIEQILGQSQAHSLPLITALCNDLMTGSAHSSTGSYDTSTLRSADSHTDSRRWSTCGPMETSVGAESYASSTGTMLVLSSGGGGGGGGRPYSWHSEHFDLDASLSALPRHRKMVPQHSHPGLLVSEPVRVLDSHHSAPHDLSATSGSGRSVLWTQAVANSSNVSQCGGSLDRHSPQLNTKRTVIPSCLNSGGHMGTNNGKVERHKAFKETIGIA